MKLNLYSVLGLLASVMLSVSCQRAELEGDSGSTHSKEGELRSRSTDAEYRANLAAHISESGAELGVVNVKFKRVVAGAVQKISLTDGGSRTGVMAVDQAVAALGDGVTMRPLFVTSEKHKAKHIKHGLDLWYEVTFKPEVGLRTACATFLNLDEVEYVETVKPIVQITSQMVGEQIGLSAAAVEGRVATRGDVAAPFNDEHLGRQWHYDRFGDTWTNENAKINMSKAWRATAGDRSVIVAVSDGGVQYTHPDLADNMWVNEGEIPGNGIDDDGNGFKDDVHGYNFGNKSEDIKFQAHGTHVAGTVAAVNNNGKGLCGIAGGTGNKDGVRLMTCDIFGGSANGREANSLIYAADNGAVISQNSWGFRDAGISDKAQEDAIDYFIAEAGNATDFPDSPMRGGVVIFASGNENGSTEYYPAAYDQVIAVSSIASTGRKSGFSNYGGYVDISAPGGDGISDPSIWSTVIDGYGGMAGTSMACPHVSGVAALLVSANKGNITPAKLREMLLSSVYSLKETEPNYSERMGAGTLNAAVYLDGDDKIAPGKTAVTLVEPLRESITWFVPKDANDPVVKFKLYYSTKAFTAVSAEVKFVELENTLGVNEKVVYTFAQLSDVDNSFNALTSDYWFAVVSLDMWGNVSELSDVLEYRAVLVDDDKVGVDRSVVGADGKLRVSWGKSFNGAAKAVVYDVAGRAVRSFDMGVLSGIGTRELDMRGLTSGNYTLKVASAGATASVRFRKL